MRLRWLVLVILCAIPLAADDEKTIGWHTVTAGETLQGITARYLGSAALWQENWKLNPGLRDPDRLTPGQKLRVIIARKLPARFADVLQVSRLVERQPTPEPWVRAAAGDRVRERDGVRTHEDASAGLRFADGATLVLGENSLVFLREPVSSPAPVPRDSIEIVSGQADVETTRPPKTKKKPTAEFEVIVAGATVKPTAGPSAPKSQTRARAATGSAELMVYGGEAAVQSGGAALTVPKGMGTRVPEGAAPGPLEKLLPAPVPLGPLAGSARGGDAFRWTAVAGAEGYAVDVCRDALCASLVASASVPGTSWSPRSLPAETLFWRVRGIPASRLDGFPSTPIAFTNQGVIAGAITDADNGSPFVGARVALHDDRSSLLASTRTDGNGQYSLPVSRPGAYWVVVDSRTLAEGAWPEQTGGPRGALCADAAGGTVTRTEAGACFGGRRSGISDDATTLETAEHVARVEAGAEGLERIDFQFSFTTVTTERDDARRPPQGSLRQFVLNANARRIPAVMRFVPLEHLIDARWTIVVADPLPELTADGIVIDGTAHGPDGELLARNAGSGRAPVAVGSQGAILQACQPVDLEIALRGVQGLVTRGQTSLRYVAISGGTTNVEAHAGLYLENVLVGTTAEGSPSTAPGTTGIAVLDRGRATMNRVRVEGQTAVGIRVASSEGTARISAQHVEVSGCATGVRIESNRSDLRYALFRQNGSAVELGSAAHAATGNIVEQCTFAGNAANITVAAGSESNAVSGHVVQGGGGSEIALPGERRP